jgi:hypothetical protein
MPLKTTSNLSSHTPAYAGIHVYDTAGNEFSGMNIDDEGRLHFGGAEYADISISQKRWHRLSMCLDFNVRATQFYIKVSIWVSRHLVRTLAPVSVTPTCSWKAVTTLHHTKPTSTTTALSLPLRVNAVRGWFRAVADGMSIKPQERRK